MSGPPPNPVTLTNLLSTQRALLDTLASFFTVAIHHILYLRQIYPPVSFVAVRAYNYPVRQNRHPDVCTWINDAIASLRDQLENNTVEKVSLCIYECDNHQVLERWTFDVHSIPVIAKKDRDVPFASPEDDAELESHINLADLEATFRATMSRISTASARLNPLPEGEGLPDCSFTLTIQVKEKADRPVGRLEATERRWIAAEPDVFKTAAQPVPPAQTTEETNSSAEVGKTHPVRRLEAGQLRLEVWVEESAHKFAFPSSQKTASQRAAEMSYGAGNEKFDPVHGYDLEEPDINRKPGGGTSTDYQRV